MPTSGKIPVDYRWDTNQGQGWTLLYEFYRPLYDGDDCRGEEVHATLGAARRAARQLGCARGVAAVWVVPTDERERVVCRWDKRTDGSYWQDLDERVRAFERWSIVNDRRPAGPAAAR